MGEVHELRVHVVGVLRGLRVERDPEVGCAGDARAALGLHGGRDHGADVGDELRGLPHPPVAAAAHGHVLGEDGHEGRPLGVRALHGLLAAVEGLHSAEVIGGEGEDVDEFADVLLEGGHRQCAPVSLFSCSSCGPMRWERIQYGST